VFCVEIMVRTTIQIKKETKDRLKRYGTLASTFDSVLNELMNHCEKCDLYVVEKN